MVAERIREIECGCKIIVSMDYVDRIEFCPLHAAAERMHVALFWLSTAIMPEERQYDEYGMTKIHRDTLREFNNRVKAALTAADNKEK